MFLKRLTRQSPWKYLHKLKYNVSIVDKWKYCSQIQDKVNEDTYNNKPTSQYELLYTSEFYNMIYLGKVTTIIYGGICVIMSPFLLLFPFDSEFIELFNYLSVRGVLSMTVLSIGVLLPRWFALITNDHVIRMYYCKRTKMIRFQTVSTFMRTIEYETNIENTKQLNKEQAFGANNIVCKNSGKQFYIDTNYLDDDIREMMGFYETSEDYDKIDE
eukprot:346621_1